MTDAAIENLNPAYGARTAGARRDAQLILEVLRATNEWSANAGRDAVAKPIRELLWFVWEQPRLRAYATHTGKAFHRGKYPSWVLWSPAARARHARNPQDRLVLEHVIPSRLIVTELIAKPPQSPAALIKVLNRKLIYAVITPEENQAITAAGFGWNLVDGDPDPWSRYRKAGLDVDAFAKLS